MAVPPAAARLLTAARWQLSHAFWTLYHRPAVRQAILDVAPSLLARLRYRRARHRWPDFNRPGDFDEKLFWLMLFDRDPLKTVCTDKLAARSWIARQGFGDMLPRLYAVYDSAHEVDFAGLPGKVALKCTHGCGFNVFRRSRADFDETAARRQLAAWMRVDWDLVLGELQYRGIPHRILAEELLEQSPGVPPLDYKMFCFNGRPEFTVVCSGRTPDGHADFDSFDRDWRRAPFCHSDREFPPPAGHQRMLEAAEAIAAHFPFVRIDFYDVGGRTLIGELTFTPAACLTVFVDREGRELFGRMLSLPERRP